jgi:hypothetical protein
MLPAHTYKVIVLEIRNTSVSDPDVSGSGSGRAKMTHKKKKKVEKISCYEVLDVLF